MANTTGKLPRQATKEIGRSGTSIYGGRIVGVDFARDLQGWLALDAFDVMRKSDPVVKAILKVVTDPILAANWDIEPASKDQRDIDIAEHAKFEFFNRKVDYYDLMREGFTFLPFGHFVAEKVYDTSAVYKGKPYIGLSAINSRKQRTILKWELDDGTAGIVQITPYGGYEQIPREKLLYVVNNQEGENYLGESMLRAAYKPWKIKDGLEMMQAVALENMGMGIPYIKKNMNGLTTTEDELQSARDHIRQQRVNEELYWEFPNSIEVGFIDMKGHTTKDIAPELKRLDEQITLSALAQFLLLGQTGGGGSRAVSQDHSRLFVKALVAVARIWQIAFQRDVINDWVDLNYSNLPNGYPKLVFSTISDEDVPETSAAVATLLQAGGLTPGLELENRLRRMLNMPELEQAEYDKRTQAQQQQVAQKSKAGAPAKTDDDPQADPNNPEEDDPAGEANPKKKPNDQVDQPKHVQNAVAEAERVEKQLLDIIARR